MIDKIASIMDNKIESMKRKLEETSSSQLNELKRIRFSEPRVFRKKGHEQQYKYNEQIKAAVSEAKIAAEGWKYDSCIAKLDEGIDLIDQRQKLILEADRSEYGWKTVGENMDNERADNDEDAKKMRKAEKEAQRKIAENRATKLAKNRSRFSRPLGSTTIPAPWQYSYSPGISSSRFPSPASSTRGPVFGGQETIDISCNESLTLPDNTCEPTAWEGGELNEVNGMVMQRGDFSVLVLVVFEGGFRVMFPLGKHPSLQYH